MFDQTCFITRFITRSVKSTAAGLLVITWIALTGCGGAVYKPINWVNHHAESDWDIDSAICLEISENLTEQDRQRVEKIKREAAETAAIYQDIGNSSSDDANSAIGSAIAFLGAALSSNKATTAEDTVKREKFVACLQEKGWSKSK